MATATEDPKATNGVVSDDTMVTSDGGSIDTMATNSRVSNIFTVTRRFGGSLENAEVNVSTLYLRQIMAGSGANQSPVTNPNDNPGLGRPTGVSNWAIYDGYGSRANLVANGQGIYTYAGKWNQWFTLEFNNKVDERFLGSTLQVMGATADDEENEWAIVGGTGEFAMARGIIKRRVFRETGDTIIQELTIQFFCRMKEVIVPAPTMRGPWGGNGGSLREMEGKSQRLRSVTFNYTSCINFMEFSYIDQDGQIRTSGIWGHTFEHPTTKTETINFRPLEWVKQINGLGSTGYLQQFFIVTNEETYGPFGYGTQGTRFSYTVPGDETVVGFCANMNTNNHPEAIGVYTIPK